MDLLGSHVITQEQIDTAITIVEPGSGQWTKDEFWNKIAHELKGFELTLPGRRVGEAYYMEHPTITSPWSIYATSTTLTACTLCAIALSISHEHEWPSLLARKKEEWCFWPENDDSLWVLVSDALSLEPKTAKEYIQMLLKHAEMIMLGPYSGGWRDGSYECSGVVSLYVLAIVLGLERPTTNSLASFVFPSRQREKALIEALHQNSLFTDGHQHVTNLIRRLREDFLQYLAGLLNETTWGKALIMWAYSFADTAGNDNAFTLTQRDWRKEGLRYEPEHWEKFPPGSREQAFWMFEAVAGCANTIHTTGHSPTLLERRRIFSNALDISSPPTCLAPRLEPMKIFDVLQNALAEFITATTIEEHVREIRPFCTQYLVRLFFQPLTSPRMLKTQWTIASLDCLTRESEDVQDNQALLDNSYLEFMEKLAAYAPPPDPREWLAPTNAWSEACQAVEELESQARDYLKSLAKIRAALEVATPAELYYAGMRGKKTLEVPRGKKRPSPEPPSERSERVVPRTQ